MTDKALVVFPYLKTSSPFKFKNLSFFDIEDIPEDAVTHTDSINEIHRMFFLRDNLQIRRMCFALVPIENDAILLEDERTLRELRAVLSYLYSSPHPTFGDTFLSDEHASLLIFKPTQVSIHLLLDDHCCRMVGPSQYSDPDDRSYLLGYEVTSNFRTNFWSVEGSQIYPPSHAFSLNISQDIYRDLFHKSRSSSDQHIVEFFSRDAEPSSFRERVLISLEWYNRSNSMHIDDDVALVNLAIAFEALLSLEQGPHLTSRFKQTIAVLLESVPRLDSWLQQFYEARSNIVHRGKVEDLRFIATDSSKGKKAKTRRYRSLVDDGRKIFQLCLRTILYGDALAKSANISSRLYTNQERFEKICGLLSKESVPPVDRLKAIEEIVDEADDCRFVEETGLELKTLVATIRRASAVFLEGGCESPDGLTLIFKELSIAKLGSDFLEPLAIIEKIHTEKNSLSQQEIESLSDYRPLNTLLILSDLVWHYTFMYFYWNKIQQDHDGSEQNSSG